jgi:hypothetical protein
MGEGVEKAWRGREGDSRDEIGDLIGQIVRDLRVSTKMPKRESPEPDE